MAKVTPSAEQAADQEPRRFVILPTWRHVEPESEDKEMSAGAVNDPLVGAESTIRVAPSPDVATTRWNIGSLVG
jgi:hypothetical protein